ncbi:Uncharacterized protein Fot_48511 [Forsythia ovata]|uniref:Transposase n=1 Tax=Forsythia ovata TaxID=205694 RepID=A0ABD1Q982_9LAMI
MPNKIQSVDLRQPNKNPIPKPRLMPKIAQIGNKQQILETLPRNGGCPDASSRTVQTIDEKRGTKIGDPQKKRARDEDHVKWCQEIWVTRVGSSGTGEVPVVNFNTDSFLLRVVGVTLNGNYPYVGSREVQMPDQRGD